MAGRKKASKVPVSFSEAVEPEVKAQGKGILETPPPYTKEWLDRHNLRVVYRGGKAELEYRK